MSVQVVIPVVGPLTVGAYIDPFRCSGQVFVGLFRFLLLWLLWLRRGLASNSFARSNARFFGLRNSGGCRRCWLWRWTGFLFYSGWQSVFEKFVLKFLSKRTISLDIMWSCRIQTRWIQTRWSKLVQSQLVLQMNSSKGQTRQITTCRT